VASIGWAMICKVERRLSRVVPLLLVFLQTNKLIVITITIFIEKGWAGWARLGRPYLRALILCAVL